MKLDDRQRATVLAALRMWQDDVCNGDYWPELPVDYGDIATNCDTVLPALNSGEVDNLCEYINASAVRKLRTGSHGAGMEDR